MTGSAKQSRIPPTTLDCFAALAMTGEAVWAHLRAVGRTGLPKPACMSTSPAGSATRSRHHDRRRREGAFADAVAADAHDPVALGRAVAGADHGARDRAAA